MVRLRLHSFNKYLVGFTILMNKNECSFVNTLLINIMLSNADRFRIVHRIICLRLTLYQGQ